MTVTDTGELVVLLGDDGQPVGTQSKATVHHESTPLHLAFSSYLYTGDGEVLLTRRALGKVAWPGVWTNTACGHPAPGESGEDAAARRLRQELGIDVHAARVVLKPVVPDFAYRAVDASGIVENEVCPVFAGEVRRDVAMAPNPDEVMDTSFVPWRVLLTVVDAAPTLVSPWCVLQVKALRDAGWAPGT